MDILNKKSMLSLFTITLLICSSHADGHLPQPRLGDPELANLIKFPAVVTRFLEKLRGKQQGIKLGVKVGKAVDHITAVCAEAFKCTPASKLCQAYCVYELEVSTGKVKSCQKFCGKPQEKCYYNPRTGVTCTNNS